MPFSNMDRGPKPERVFEQPRRRIPPRCSRQTCCRLKTQRTPFILARWWEKWGERERESLSARGLREGSRSGQPAGPRSQVRGRVCESRPASPSPSRDRRLGVAGPGESAWAASRRASSRMLRSPAGSEVSEGAGGPEITEEREPRIRRHSGQGLREGMGRAAPAGPFGTRREGVGGTGRSAPRWGAWTGLGRVGRPRMAEPWTRGCCGGCWGVGRRSGAQPGPGARP